MKSSTWKPLGDHLLEVETWNPTRQAIDQGFRYIDLSSVDNQSKRITAWQSLVGQDAPSRARQVVRAEDILVSTVRPNLNGVACVPRELDGATASTGFCVLRPDQRRLRADYLFQWVKSPGFVSDMVQQATGASYPAVSDRVIFKSQIPLLPLQEQCRVAAILNQADDLRRKRHAARNYLQELAIAKFRALFVVGKSSPTITTTKLAELCDLVRGSSPRPQGDPRYFGGSVPRLMIADITRDGMFVSPKIDSLTLDGAARSRPMPAGAVVMAVSGAAGLPAILSVDACIHDGFVGFRKLDPRVSPEFLYFWLLSVQSESRSKGTGAVWVNLTTDQVKNFDVPIVSQKIQADFMLFTRQLRAVRARFNDQLARLDSLVAPFNIGPSPVS